jgi:hypothetical protein
MVLIDWLYAVGGKLGIIQVVHHRSAESQSAPPKIMTRTVELKDLVTEIQTEEVRSLAQMPAELAVSFDKVFETAGIQPAGHGWTVAKLRDLLRAEPYKSMDREAVQKALVPVLAQNKVVVEDLVRDAMSRDKALDAFEEVAHGKTHARAEARQRRQAQLRSQIDDLNRQCQQLEQEQASDQQHWQQWHDRKIEFEKEMAWAIGYLVDRPVVTIDQPHP